MKKYNELIKEYLEFKHSRLELNNYEKIADYIQNTVIEENKLESIKSLEKMLKFYKVEEINSLGNYESLEIFLNDYIRRCNA